MFPVTDVQGADKHSLSLSQIYIACFHSDIDTNSSGNCAIIIQTGHAKYANTSADCRYCMSS